MCHFGDQSTMTTKRIWNKDFVVLCIICSITTFTNQSLNTVLSLYAQDLGASLSVAGTVVGMASVASTLILPFSGPLSNRVDKRFLTLLSSVFVLIGMLGFAFVKTVDLLLVCRFFIGLGFGLSSTCTMVMVTKSLPPDSIVVGMGLYGLVGIVVQSVGPAAALAVETAFGYDVLFLLSAFLCLLQAAAVMLLPKYPPMRESGARFSVKEIIAPEALLTAGIGFLFAFNNGVQLAFVSSYAEAAGFGHAGMFFAVQAVFSALSRVLLSKLTSRHTVSFATTIAGVFLILFSLALGLGKNLLHFYLASAFFGIGYGTLLPVTQSVSITRTPESRRASGSSTYGLGIQLAFAVSGTAGGLIADRFGYAAMFLSLIVPSMAAMLLGLWKGNFPVSPAAGGSDRNGTNDPGNG